MFSNLLARPSLAVQLQEDQVFVQPHVFHPDSPGLSKDPILYGTVTLTLPAARAVSKLKVVLEGEAAVQGGDGQPYEVAQTLHKELVIRIDETLEAGSHSFRFTFLIPHNTPVYQKSRYGRVETFVRASASFSGSLNSSVKSERSPLFVVATENGLGDGLAPTDVSLQVYSDDLGPVGISFSSPHLTIASLMSFQATLLATPPTRRIRISSIRAVIHQKTEVRYPKSGKVVQPAGKRVPLRVVDMSPPPPSQPDSPVDSKSQAYSRYLLPSSKLLSGKSFDLESKHPILPVETGRLADVGPNEVYNYSKIVRVPDGAYLRATTIEGSDIEPIVHRHVLGAEICYLREGEIEEKTFSVSKDIVLGHCAELADIFFLPTYADLSDLPQEHGASVCSCMLPIQAMIERDRAAFERASNRSAPPTPEAVAAAGNKTPSYFHAGPSLS